MKTVSKALVWITMLVVATSVCAQTPTRTQAGASPRLLTPQNAVLVLIDHQPQMAFAAQSMDTQLLVNNVTGLAKAAKVFKVVWSKNSCGLIRVVFQEPPEPFSTVK